MEGISLNSAFIHKANVQKGFYEQRKNGKTISMLIMEEVGESITALRKHAFYLGKHPHYVKSNLNGRCNVLEEQEPENYACKGTFQEECADIIIRFLDLLGYCDINVWLSEIIEPIELGNKELQVLQFNRNFNEPAARNSYTEIAIDVMHSIAKEVLKAAKPADKILEAKSQNIVPDGFKDQIRNSLELKRIVAVVFAGLQMLVPNLSQHIEYKLLHNATRPHKHGKQF